MNFLQLIRNVGLCSSSGFVEYTAVGILLLSVAGCGIIRGDSPEEAFGRLKKAAADENWQVLLASLDDSSQKKLVAIHWAVVALASLADKEAQALLRKYDAAVEDILGAPLLGLVLGKAEPEKIVQEIEQKMGQIKDRHEFLRETNSWLQGKGFGERSFLSQLRRTELRDLRIEKETATAELTEPILLNQTRITFRKEGHRWLVVL